MPPALQNPFAIWALATAALGGLAYAFIRTELRVRATLYASFLAACAVAMWPPFPRGDQPGKIPLGLDLKGGVHLVLQVMTDDALNVFVDDRVQAIRRELSDKGIAFSAVERRSPTSYAVEGVEPARVKDVQEILRAYAHAANEPGGWDIQSKDNGFVVEMSKPLIEQLRTRTVTEAKETLERRVNQLGVAEPVVAIYGSHNDQILVQLPGVKNIEAAKRVIVTTAQLLLKLVEKSAPSRDALLEPYQGKVPPQMEVVEGRGAEAGERTYYLVRREAVITGLDLKSARVGVDENNQPAVSFTLNAAGAAKFRDATGRNIGRQLAVILDNYVESAPVIQARIGAEGQISGGHFTNETADELAKVLRAGALPASLKYLQELTVGASLGQDSIRSGVLASLAAMAFIAAFLLIYYRLAGVNAIVALAANLLILLGTMAYFSATLTLPGIAGIILTIGVGVDTNVLVFERIREELRQGKTVKAAVANGFDRVWIVIIDTHATALISAAFLFQFGTGPIKGFAVTLVVGLVANVFASYFVSKFLFEWVLGRRPASSLSI
jgi:preprotein translocase subunit SecD